MRISVYHIVGFDNTKWGFYMTVTKWQIRVARLGLEVSQERLAEMSMVGVNTVKRCEAGSVETNPSTLAAMADALSQLGASFGDDEVTIKRLEGPRTANSA